VGVYLDTNVLVALLSHDTFRARAFAIADANLTTLIVSDFAAAEFASVIAAYVRIGSISASAARTAFDDFDSWAAGTQRERVSSEDIAAAGSLLRRLDINLRAPDAIHLAASQRLRAELATFDKALVSAARVLKIPLASA